jgi:hypothetical protein
LLLMGDIGLLCSFMLLGMVSKPPVLCSCPNTALVPNLILTCPQYGATGTQYSHLCKVLLSLYKPDIPSPGSGLMYSRAHLEMEVCAVVPWKQRISVLGHKPKYSQF